VRVEHGVYTVNGQPRGDRKVTLRLDLADPLLETILRAVWDAVTDSGGDERSLRHITAEVRFEQSKPGKYEPVSGKVVGVHG
jgi:hypothetical protein